MGTRSWTRFYRVLENDSCLAATEVVEKRELLGIVYRYFDGYPEGVGVEVLNFLSHPCRQRVSDARELFNSFIENLQVEGVEFSLEDISPQSLERFSNTDEIGFLIEWVYDVIVKPDQSVTVRIIPGGYATDIYTAQLKIDEWIVSEGSPAIVREWIKRNKPLTNLVYDAENRTVTHIKTRWRIRPPVIALPEARTAFLFTTGLVVAITATTVIAKIYKCSRSLSSR